MNMPKVHYICFGSSGYEPLTGPAYKSACDSHIFNQCTVYTEKDLSPRLMAQSVMRQKRGYGYWTWKADIILAEMAKVDEGDILVYLDSDVDVMPNAKAWNDVFGQLSKECFLYAMKLYQPMLRMTKKSALDAFGYTRKMASHLRQLSSSVIILRKCKAAVSFVEEWYRLMTENDGFLVVDRLPSEKDQYPGFDEHRHDQAVFSMLVYSRLLPNQVKIKWENFVNRSPFNNQFACDRYQGPMTLRSRIRYLVKRVIVRPVFSIFDAMFNAGRKIRREIFAIQFTGI